MVCQVPGWPAGDSFFRSRHPGHLFSRAAGLQPVLIFLLGGQSAADVALRLVDVQHHPAWAARAGLRWVRRSGDVFMYRTLRYPKLFRRLAHRSILVYDVIGDLGPPVLRYIPSWVFPWERFVHHMKPVELL